MKIKGDAAASFSARRLGGCVRVLRDKERNKFKNKNIIIMSLQSDPNPRRADALVTLLCSYEVVTYDNYEDLNINYHSLSPYRSTLIESNYLLIIHVEAIQCVNNVLHISPCPFLFFPLLLAMCKLHEVPKVV